MEMEFVLFEVISEVLLII